MILKIKSVKSKPFSGEEGEKINYFWTKGENPQGIIIQFGSKIDHTKAIGKSEDIAIEEQIFSNGKRGYRESVD